MGVTVKQNGAWVEATPWVKHNGAWVIPEAVWVKQNGAWVPTFTQGTSTPPQKLTYLGQADRHDGAASAAFPTMPLGDADPDRWILVGIFNRTASGSNANVSSVTVAGNSASRVATGTSVQAKSVTAASSVEWWIADLRSLSATSGQIAVYFAAASMRNGIKVYRLLSSTATAHDVEVAGTSGITNPLSVTIDIPTDGVALALYGSQGPGNSNTVDWTNATVDHTSLLIGNNSTFSSATSTLDGSTAITGHITGTSNTRTSMCVVSFG